MKTSPIRLKQKLSRKAALAKAVRDKKAAMTKKRKDYKAESQRKRREKSPAFLKSCLTSLQDFLLVFTDSVLDSLGESSCIGDGF